MIEIKVHNQTSQTLKLWDFQRGKKEKKKITLNQKIHIFKPNTSINKPFSYLMVWREKCMGIKKKIPSLKHPTGIKGCYMKSYSPDGINPFSVSVI